MAIVFVPYALRKYCEDKNIVEISATNLGELIDNLEIRYPGTKAHIIEDGAIKPGVAAVVNHTTTRKGLLEKIDDDSEIHFINAVSGGIH
ncbi:MAG: MoaD/ThiS family protein [Dehalococcoidia bacterium]